MRSRLGGWLVRLLVQPGEREWVTGDLEELHAARVERNGKGSADRRYWRDLLSLALGRLRSLPPPHRHVRGSGRRAARPAGWLADLAQDTRYAARTLRKAPGFAAAVIITLALGIGTSVMIYTVARTLVTDAIPFPLPERLVTVDVTDDRGLRRDPAWDRFRQWESLTAPPLTLGAYSFGERFVGDGTRTYHVFGSRVTGDFFRALAVDPLFGRTVSVDDAAPGAAQVAVITERLWTGQLGADPAVIGRSLLVDGVTHTIIGVVPEGHQFPAGADVWTPLRPAPGDADLRVSVIGRLDDGASQAEAAAALNSIRAPLDPGGAAGESTTGVAVRPLTGGPSSGDATGLLLLQCAVLVLLLIASTNAAGLILGRTLERRQEIAMRLSLGAGRGRIVRQFLTESALLGIAAGALGVVVAYAGIAGLRQALPATMTRHMMGWDRLGIDAHALAWALGVAILTGIASGILPALRGVRGSLPAQLREGTPTASRGPRGSRIARVLLGGEVALALTLLLTAGLFTRSLVALMQADPGFEADDVLAVKWALPPERYERQDAVARFHDPLLERVRALPGVRSAALVSNLPMSRTGWTRSYRLPGSDPDAEDLSASWRPVTAGYLPMMDIALLRGRGFVPADDVDASGSAIISRALAELHWSDGADPIGRQLEAEGRSWTVVGVAQDVHNFGVDRPAEPTIYVPQAQSPSMTGFLILSGAGAPAGLAGRIREEIWDLDPAVAVGQVQTVSAMVRDFHADARAMALLMAVFASIALLIAVVSLYTLVAYSVARRRHEIGIRLALGARPRQILIGAMAYGVVWVGVGIVFGLLLSAAAAQVLEALLYGVRPLDPAVFAVVTAGMLAVATIASLVPALRATRVDPVDTLRGG